MREISRFDPISLADLVADAGLMTRLDRKYLLPIAALDSLFGQLDPATRVLEIEQERTFRYRSVYFDTPDLKSYHTAAQPRRLRFKVRTRSYVETGGAFVEVKLRGPRGVTAKSRREIAHEDVDDLTDEARTEVARMLEAGAVDGGIASDLRPTVTSTYERTTLLAHEGFARATIDTALAWRDHEGECLRLPDMAIVETKSAAQPSDIDRRLWRMGYRPQSMSKYGTGMAVLRPHLPSNRWTRLVRGPFSGR
ncbi:polyphosphate polymerase domain-containing protein [Microbacterium sp. NC79]|uniref:polyphosphate polymerase domain-containing protein n=1 Tax=Microbacterium sp. NC79 TaxID=2851009 RepID=UPI001C2C3D44|nr:polyphosphate polymerase domain-containing protein [Microbacterium sp. NC79]MBV0895192.1 polyphosphate polymerase domain-containing protein [Microbacterium sp. NC79]